MFTIILFQKLFFIFQFLCCGISYDNEDNEINNLEDIKSSLISELDFVDLRDSNII